MSGLDWTDSDEAKRLLAEWGVAFGAGDHYAGLGWTDVCRSFSERCEEIESDLDELRREALDAFANAASPDHESDVWFDAWDEADDEAETVKRACERANGAGMGDGLREAAAA